jgi:ketosteroid isomerase-like protein
MLGKSADALADLYAEEAVHEIPFAVPGFPPRFEGREAVRAAYGVMWKKSPVVIERVDSVAVYQATDPEVVIVEQMTTGSAGPGGPRFSMPSLLVLRVRNGLIVQCRDYMDGLALSRARSDGQSAA